MACIMMMMMVMMMMIMMMTVPTRTEHGLERLLAGDEGEEDEDVEAEGNGPLRSSLEAAAVVDPVHDDEFEEQDPVGGRHHEQRDVVEATAHGVHYAREGALLLVQAPPKVDAHERRRHADGKGHEERRKEEENEPLENEKGSVEDGARLEARELVNEPRLAAQTSLPRGVILVHPVPPIEVVEAVPVRDDLLRPRVDALVQIHGVERAPVLE